MQLLTCLHNPAEQAHQDIGGDWDCPDILRGTCSCRLRRPALSWAPGALEGCDLMLCQWTTMTTLTGIMQPQPICQQCHCQLREPRSSQSSEPGLAVPHWCGASACLGPDPQPGRKGVIDHSQCLAPVCSQQHRVTGTAGLLLSQAREERFQSLYSETGLSLLKRPNTKQLLRTNKKSPVCWPPKTVNDVTFSLRSQKKSVVWDALRNEHFVNDWLK